MLAPELLAGDAPTPPHPAPRGVVRSRTAQNVLAEYFAEARTTSSGAAPPWLSLALLHGPGAECNGDSPVARTDYCAGAAWNAVHVRRRAGLVLMLWVCWLLLAAGAWCRHP